MSNQSTFFKFFPPPKFLAPDRTGLAISEEAVRVIGFSLSRGSLVLSEHKEIELSPEALVHGEIKNEAELKSVLQKFRKDCGIRFVRASVPERKTYIVKMEIPLMKDSEIRETVEMHLEEYIPLSASEAVFDYQILGVTGPAGDRLMLQVSAIHKDVIENYINIFKGTGITPVSFEIEAQAVARCVIPKDDTRTFMIVDFGAFRTGIYMVVGGLVEFTTSIDMSGKSLTDLFYEKFGMKKEDVEALKRKFNCSDSEKCQEDEHTAVLLSFISVFRDEVSKHLEYWKTHKKVKNEANAIDEIILTGSEADIEGLSQYLAETLDVPVSFAGVWQNVFDLNKHVPKISRNESFKYAGAIGLAMLDRY